MGQGCPDLLPADQPLAAAFIETGAGLDIGQVGTCAGLGIALAPKILPRQNRRQKTLLLLGGTEGCNGRPDQPFANMTHAPRTTRSGVLFKKNNLLIDTQSTAPMLGGPTGTDPLPLSQYLLPAFTQRGGKVFIPRATTKAQNGKFASEVRLHPLGHSLPELLICCAKADIHVHSPKICLANCSR